MPPESSKDALRARLNAERSALSAAQWVREDRSRTAWLLEALPDDARVVAAYASRAGEPGTAALLETLVRQGRRVLLPLLGRRPDWAWFTGTLVAGWGGIPQPEGPALGEGQLRTADLVIIPCLAVGQDGTRLGTGGGWYDRALLHRRAGTPAWALARGAEVLPTVPSLPHDVAVEAVVTEHGFSPLAKP